jgi:hypothetical protein
MFPNVDVSAFQQLPSVSRWNFKPSDINNDNGTTFNSVHQDLSMNKLDWGKEGPTSAANGPSHVIPPKANQGAPLFNTPNRLPTVNHDVVLKRVILPYLGCEQSYTWYLQLKSNAQQYGVYLKSMTEFKKDMSICPKEMFGILISST